MKLLDKFARTKARLKIGKSYVGEKGRFIAQGYVLFKEWDKEDGRYYYWEEWELTGFEDYDTWIEYDHYSDKITLYEPVRVKEIYDVNTLRKGQSISLHIANNSQPTTGTVEEAGTGSVVRLRGKMSYQLFPDDIIHYAEVKTSPTTVISIEDYRQLVDTDYDYYAGRILTKAEQRVMFGKVLSPPLILKNMITLIIFAIFIIVPLIFSFIPQYETVCTPRTVPKTSNNSFDTTPSSTNMPNSSPMQDCQRVRVYGGGGSGVGK